MLPQPHQARAAGLKSIPDSICWADSADEANRGIEVKGPVGIGEVVLNEKEWVRACNQRDRYWLYVVFDCGTSHPRLLRVGDPFGKLVVRAMGGVRIDGAAIFDAAEGDGS